MKWMKYYEAHTKESFRHAKIVMGQNIKRPFWDRYWRNAAIAIKCLKQNVIPFMDLSVGTICTLRCTNCSQWNPYLKRKTWFDAQDIIDQLEQMFQTVDYIFGVGVIGGEPLVYKDLDKILEYLCRNRKVGYIVIVTNGTVYPSKKIIQYMKHPKVITWVSFYAAVAESENRKRLLALLEDERQGINHRIFYDLVWTDMGLPKKKPFRYSKETVRQSFDSCWLRNCSIYIEGVLYRCNRCYGIIDQGVSEFEDRAEIIDFKKINGKKELKKKIREFYGLEYVKACYWCNDISHRAEVKAGVQLNDN